MIRHRIRRSWIPLLALLGVIALAQALAGIGHWVYHWWSLQGTETGVIVACLMTLRILLWPGLIASRLGFSYTIVVVSFVCALLIWWSVRRMRAQFRSSASRALVMGLLPWVLYLWFGWLWVFLVAVPDPPYPVGEMGIGQDPPTKNFLEGYDLGYRFGMIDLWEPQFLQGLNLDPEIILASGDGYAAGVREWERLAPGFFVGSYVLPQRSRR